MAEQKCVYGHVWGDPVPQTAASLGRMVLYGSQDPVLPVQSVTGPWVQGLIGTYTIDF